MYFLNYNNPWVYGNHGSIEGEIYQYSTESAVYNFQYQIKGFEIGTGFYNGEKHRYNAEVGVKFYYMDSTSSTSSNYNKLIAQNYYPEYHFFVGELKYQFDTRDIYIDPSQGEYFSIVLEQKLSINKLPDYYSMLLTYKKYFHIHNYILDPVLSLKSKLVLQFSDSFPLFAYKYMGGEGYVRGYTPTIQKNPTEIQNYIQGFNIYYQNIQLQHTIIEKKDYSGVEIGMDIVYFADFGISTNEINLFQLSHLIYGYGFGLRLFISGPGVISLDFGFNPYGGGVLHPTEGNY